MHIITSAQVSRLIYDEDDPIRVAGVEWYREYEQDRPQQNRRDINVGVTCKPDQSAFGVGLENSRDCSQEQFTLQNVAGLEPEIKEQALLRTAKNSYYVSVNGAKNSPHQFLQTGLP